MLWLVLGFAFFLKIEVCFSKANKTSNIICFLPYFGLTTFHRQILLLGLSWIGGPVPRQLVLGPVQGWPTMIWTHDDMNAYAHTWKILMYERRHSYHHRFISSQDSPLGKKFISQLATGKKIWSPGLVLVASWLLEYFFDRQSHFLVAS